MVDFVEYVVSELKSKRLGKAGALELIRQFSVRRTAPEQLHPLVHRNVSTLTQQRYRTHLRGDESFLRDHRVRMPSGAAVGVLPGVAYLEMARAAVVDAVPELADGALLAFEDVLWLSPFAVDSARDILIDIDAGDDCLAFRVFSEDAASGQPAEHASGRVRFYDTVDAASLDLADVRAAMTRDHWDAATVYATYAQVGIEYGPAHRGIVRLDSGDGQVLGELVLPDSVAGQDAAAYGLHPSLIDSALQAAIGLGERGVVPGDPMLPFALESLCILGDCGTRPYVFVRKADTGSTDTAQLTLDLDVCDEHGNLCVQMRGFGARRFETRGMSAALDAGAVETLVAVPGWGEPLPPADADAATKFDAVRVLLCDLPGRDALAATLAGADVQALAAPADADPAQRYEAIALQLFERLQDALKHAGGRTLLQCAIADDTDGPLLTGLGGLLRTATLENPSLATQLVLVDPQASPERIAADLADAAARPHLAQLRCSADGRRAQVWTVLPPTSDADVGESPYREQGVYLVTGGLGGLGVLFAREILAQSGGAQVVLTGRSADDDALRTRLASAFADCADVGRVHYRQLDLDDAAQCAQVVDAIGRELGAIRGVLHCAGTRHDEVILKKTAQDMAAVLAPKVRGAWHLDAATAGLDLDFFALFSSGVAAFGNVGQADYAAANGFLDAFAAVRAARVAAHERSGRTVSIAWPLWDAGGMRPDPEAVRWLQAQTGMVPMRTASGLAVFRRALAAPHAQVFAIEGDGRRLRRLFDAPTPPAPRAAAPAPVAVRETAPGPVATETVAAAPAGDLLTRTRDFLRREFAPVLKIAANQIDLQEALESYGINSILAMTLTARLEQHFGALPKTLFFEYQTIAALSEHLVQAHADRLQALLAPAAGATTPAAPAASAQAAVEPAVVRQAAKPALRGKAAAPGVLLRRGPSALSTASESIAIVGLSGRYPESESLREFWRNLHDGRDCIVEVPAERWNWRDYYTEDREQPGHYSKWGGFISGADEFDPQFFNISPREAPYIDPQERMFLQHAWMAIEDAGYSRKSLRLPRANGLSGQVGVYAGVMYGEYNRSGSLASIANRVSYALNVHGPSMTLDTMCSSSLTAIHLACQDLRLGRTDMALA
ncbi:MAG: SDR family NAD(P)-dependent oxidoreductase, partial [Lysobacteraceae bacterium]